MNKSVVIKAASGGVFVGMSATAMLFNSAMHSPPFFVASGIAGRLGGLVLIALAFGATK